MKRILLAAAVVAAPSFAAADACLTGVWQANLDNVASLMAAQMGGSAEVVGGNVIMVMDPGGLMDIAVNNLTISVTPPNVPTVEVSVNGYSRGTLSTDGGAFNSLVADYSLVGSSMVMGQRMDIPFDSRTGMFGTASGTYTCDESTLRMQPADGTPANAVVGLWQRRG